MKIKALQIASFDGNIGDIANHTGFRQSLEKYSENDFEFESLEMRNFYQNWGLMSFDDSFVQLANNYDLIVFGGGGFFRTNIKESNTGATIDLSKEVLNKIHTPILFNCLGVGASNTSIVECEKRFVSFLKYITDSDQFMVTVRNDGSHQRIKELCGNDIANSVLEVPDGGFFCKPNEYLHAEINDQYRNIAVNVACDQSGIRYPGGEFLSEGEFVEEFSKYCLHLLEMRNDVRIIFVPHIYSDYYIILKILGKIPDQYVRTRICCSAYLNGMGTDGLSNFDIYRNADLVIGMRYHANVVSIGMNVPTIGIVNLDEHIKLFENIGIQNRCVVSNVCGFSEKLFIRTEEALDNPEQYRAENQIINGRLQVQNIDYINRIDKWLKNVCIIKEIVPIE